MALADLPVERTRPEDIAALIEGRVPEDRRLDYKLQLPGSSPDDAREFLRDVTAFANATGALIVYGVEEEAGIPVRVAGLSVSDLDAERQRLQSLALSRAAPRIPSLTFHPIFMNDGASLLLLRIGRSWIGPHATTDRDRLEFWIRHGAQKQRMDLTELRQAFTATASLSDYTRRLRDERLEAIGRGEPMLLLGLHLMTLHIIPFSAVDGTPRFDVPSIASELRKMNLLTGGSARRSRYDFDGFLLSDEDRQGNAEGYTLFFRSGVLEAAANNFVSNLPGGGKAIPAVSFETCLISALKDYLWLYDQIAADPPAKLFLRFSGVRGLHIGGGPRYDDHRPITRNVLDAQTIIEAWDQGADRILKPLIDQVWNASGFPGSPHFTDDGRHDPDWRLRKREK